MSATRVRITITLEAPNERIELDQELDYPTYQQCQNMAKKMIAYGWGRAAEDGTREEK